MSVAFDGAYLRELGFTEHDVPALLEIVRRWENPDIFEDVDDEREAFASVHAWRALAELRAPALVPTLLSILDALNEMGDDWSLEEFPSLFAHVGASVIEPLERFLLDSTHREYARVTAAHGLKDIAVAEPEVRDRVVAVFVGELERHDSTCFSLNGFLVSYLVDLEAVEHADVIERAFAAGTIEEFVCGDWPRIAYELGLGPEPPPRGPRWLTRLDAPARLEEAPSSPRKGNKTSKSRRKQQKKSRKKNRRNK
ncbi:MAG: DUF1186 domain-containing protein [Nannocystaceae bacterium]